MRDCRILLSSLITQHRKNFISLVLYRLSSLSRMSVRLTRVRVAPKRCSGKVCTHRSGHPMKRENPFKRRCSQSKHPSFSLLGNSGGIFSLTESFPRHPHNRLNCHQYCQHHRARCKSDVKATGSKAQSNAHSNRDEKCHTEPETGHCSIASNKGRAYPRIFAVSNQTFFLRNRYAMGVEMWNKIVEVGTRQRRVWWIYRSGWKTFWLCAVSMWLFSKS